MQASRFSEAQRAGVPTGVSAAVEVDVVRSQPQLSHAHGAARVAHRAGCGKKAETNVALRPCGTILQELRPNE
jgi:hypothetical protein